MEMVVRDSSRLFETLLSMNYEDEKESNSLGALFLIVSITVSCP